MLRLDAPLWRLPFTEGHDVKDGQIISETFRQRLDMLVRDTRIYGELLARQRHADLRGTDPGFLARHRS